MKNKNSNKKIFILVVSLVTAIVFFMINWFIKKNFTYIIETSPNINQCYDAKITNENDIVVLDSGHSRIMRINSDCFVEEIISPDGYVDNMVLDEDGNIWTQESYWDGMWVSDEFIVKYKDGKREEFYHYNYGDLSSKHKIFGLSIQGDKVIYVITEQDKIRLVTHVDGALPTKYIEYENAFNAVSDVCIKGDDVYILDKSGEIFKTQFASYDDLKLIYNVNTTGTEITKVPYAIAVDDDNKIYFTDIRNHSVQMVNEDKKSSITVIKNTSTAALSIHKGDNDNIFLLSETDKLVLNKNGKEDIITELYFSGYNSLYRIASLVSYILFIIFTVLFVICLVLVAVEKFSTTRLLIAITMVLSIIVATLLMHMLLNEFTNTYSKNIYNQLEISAYVVANRISPNDIDLIDDPSDYKSDAYKRINDIMTESYPIDVDFNKNIYCNILTINDYDEPCAIAYLDQTIGVYYPLDEEEQEEVRTVYETRKTLWNDAKEDISGTYFYVKVPVIADSGVVKGCVAAGIPLEILTNDINRIRHDMIVSSIVILLLLFIVITEVSKILDYKYIYDKEKLLDNIKSFPGHMLMLLIILVFAAYNMSSTFLPIFIIRRIPDINISKEFLASLPIAINIFIIGFMSLFCARLIKIFGIKNVLIFTVLFSIVGNVIIFIYPTYIGVFIGLILDGIGVGIITNTCYIIITFLCDEVMKLEGFAIYNTSCISGINIGMLLGSIIAVNCDYNYVFLFVIGAWIIVMFSASGLYKSMESIIEVKEIVDQKNNNNINFVKFISSNKVNTFFMLMQNPAIVFNSFVYYFLPIYCDNHGFSATVVSILFIIYSEIAILTGDISLKFLNNKFGNKTMYIGFFANVIAVLIYGILGNTIGIVIALCILGFSAGFLKPSLQNHFISIKQVGEYGEDNAMGVYNFTENIGESLGPIIFSGLMAFSPMIISIAPFSVIVSSMGMLHIMINKIKNKG